MTALATAIETVRRVNKKLGTAAFARLADVPYTTLRDCESRDFTGQQIETLQKLAAAAEAYEQGETGRSGEGGTGEGAAA